MDKELRGKRYIALARCSSPGQIDTSIDEQLKLIDHFGRAQGMTCAGKVTLGGVTGSVPGVRNDIDQIILRKQEQNDFEVVVIQDATRLTRSGTAHGMYILYRLRAVGLRLVTVKDELPEGPLGDLMCSMQHYASAEQARSGAYAVTRGMSASLREGRSAHCKAPPYGVDRLYASESREPRHVIRNLADGTQVKLHLETGAVIERFGRNAKSGVPSHYLKQKTEYIHLVPGDPAHVAVVREIYERHYREGHGYYRLALDLNNRGVPSPRGKRWGNAQIRSIVYNPIYLGMGMANVITSGIYYKRTNDGLAEAPTTAEELAKGRPPRRTRKREEWFERPEPLLSDLLDPSIQELASAKQAARFDAIASGHTPRRDCDRHRDSSFILKGVLTSRQGGCQMTGRRTGKRKGRKRYYAVSKAYFAPGGDPTMRRLIPAEPLEKAVLAALQEALADCPRVHQVIRALAKREVQASHGGNATTGELQAEKGRIEAKLSLIIDEMDELGRDAVRTKMKQLQVRLKEVIDEIRRLSDPRPPIDDPDAVADAVCAKMSSLADQIPSLTPTAVRQLLSVFVERLVVDLETRQAEVVLALPEWVGVDADRLCLATTSVYKGGSQAHPIPGMVLAGYQLFWQKHEAAYRLKRLPLRGGRRAA